MLCTTTNIEHSQESIGMKNPDFLESKQEHKLPIPCQLFMHAFNWDFQVHNKVTGKLWSQMKLYRYD